MHRYIAFALQFMTFFPIYSNTLICTEEYVETICRNVNFDLDVIENTTNFLVVQDSSGTIKNTNFANLSLTELTVTTSSFSAVGAGAFCSPENLTSLNLIYNVKFPNLSQEMFDNCAKLKKLQIDGETIDNGAFTSMEKLKSLVINDTKLPDVVTKDFFKGLKALELLDIRYSQFKNFQKDSFALLDNLQNLVLQNNNLENVQLESLEKLLKLVSLDLSNNRLNNTIWKQLRSKSLKVLFLENNKINDIDTKSLENLPELERVFLSGKLFISEKITQIDRELKNRHIRLVWLS